MLRVLTSAPSRLFSALLVSAVFIGVVVHLAQAVVANLTLLDTAASDNVQWTLAQVEVDFVDLERQIYKASSEEAPDLAPVQRDFDIFFSRARVVAEGQLYGQLRSNSRYDASIGAIEVFLDETVPFIDQGGAALKNALPSIYEKMEVLRPAVRDLSITGLGVFAKQADARRQGIAQTLMRLAMVTVALLSVLLLSALLLARMARQGFRRANVLQATSSRLETIIATALDAVVVTNRIGQIIEFNGAAESIFGYMRGSVIGRDISDIIVPPHLRAAHAAGVSRYLRTGKRKLVGAGRIRLEAMRSNGEIFPMEFSIQSALGTEGEIFISFIRDISQIVQAERELVTARDQAVAGERAKTEFLAVMSHELRTPLNGLLGTLSLLQDTSLTEKQRSYAETMESSGALLLNHVNDVLDITKYEAGKLVLELGPVNPSAVISDVVDTLRDLASTRNNALEWQTVGEDIPTVLSDGRRLRQILINLVGNAVKFTDSGRIWVDVELIRKNDKEPMLEIRVTDTGIGIDSDSITRIFHDFETGDASYNREKGGTGLGLGIARRLAELLGGEIGAESTLGVGSCFWLRIPADEVDPATIVEEKKSRVPQRYDGPKRSVLIVEDNEINRRVLREMLEADGHTVAEAIDGHDGVNKANDHSYDIILMDISMPRLDGRGATVAIRNGDGPCKSTSIIAVTAHALPQEIEDFRKHGMDDYISKPIKRGELRHVMVAAGWAESEPVQTQSFEVAGAAPVSSEMLTDASSAPKKAANFKKKHRKATVMPDVPLIDTDQIKQLVEDIGPEAMEQFLNRFITEGETIIAQSEVYIDPEAYVASLHRLAGSAAVFGAVRLRASLNEAESVWKEVGDDEVFRPLLAPVPAIWSESVEALREAAR
jgi:PAS domain S-box-containing protein